MDVDGERIHSSALWIKSRRTKCRETLCTPFTSSYRGSQANCRSCYSAVKCVPHGGNSRGALWLQPTAVAGCWPAEAPSLCQSPRSSPHTDRAGERGSLFAEIAEKSVLPWPCFSVAPILASRTVLRTDLSLNVTVICRTRGECSEKCLEADGKGQVNGYVCANTDSDPRGAAESAAVICSRGAGRHSAEPTSSSDVSSLCLISH